MAKKLVMLIVDDMEVNRALLKNIFKDEYEILEAADGMEAVDIMKQRADIIVILLDIVMPNMDGIEFLRYKKDNLSYDKIPVIVNTEHGQEENELKALELGASDFIVKPYTPIIIKHRVQNVVNKSVVERLKIEATLRETMDELRYRAERDFLTGIYNRETFYIKTKYMLENSKEDYVLILWNIERFKLINDMFGQSIGDEILKEIAQGYENVLKEKGTYARLEADHFVTCFPKKLLNIDKILKEIQSAQGSYTKLYNVFINFGIYMIQDKKLAVGLMCDRAQLALQTVKGNYLKHYAIYDDTLRNHLLEEQELTGEIDNAILQKQFMVYLQPIYSVIDKKPVSAEALIRWKHPKKGFIAPDVFVPLFEKNGLITKIDAYVLEEVCRFLQQAKKDGLPAVPVSVNLSRINFYNNELCKFITKMVGKYGLDNSMLRFEITESIYTDNPRQLLKIMRALQSKGFKILMDDFGSGYSSLNMLKDVPVDILKIDMKFIDDLEHSNRAGNIVTSVIRMAKWLNMMVIAEGVETKVQLDFLRSVGCDNIQGYYFSKPLPLENFVLLLKDKESILLKESKQDILAMFDLDLAWDMDQKNNLIFNEMIGGMGVYELSGNTLEIIRANQGYFEIMGDNLGASNKFSNVLDRVYEEDRQKLLDTCRLAEKTKQVEEVITRRYVKNNEIKWLNVKLRFLGKAGRRGLFYFAFNDITKQKEYEQNSYINQYSLVLQGVYNDIYELNYTDQSVYMLKKDENALYPYEKVVLFEMAVMAYAKDVHPEDRDNFTHYFEEAVIIERFEHGERKEDRFPMRVKRRDGQYHWVEVIVLRFEEPMGKRIYLACHRDIDEKKRAEHKDIQRMLDHIPVGLAICELNKKIKVKYLNEKVYGMFGFNSEKIEDLNELDIDRYLLLEEDKYAEFRRNLSDDKGSLDKIIRCKKVDNSIFWVRIFASVIKGPNQKPVCYALLEEVTKQMEINNAVPSCQ